MSEAHPLEVAESVYAGQLARLSAEDWLALYGALQAVETAGSFGRWTEPTQQSDGSWQMPYATLSDECSNFMQILGRLGLHIPFDWSAWEHGRTLAEVPERLEHASRAEAAMLIFAIWRSDRFVEGELLDAFERGLMQRAARRMLSAS